MSTSMRAAKPSLARWLQEGWGMTQKTNEVPREQRRGRLRNGNPSGDFSKAARCGAKNRRGTPCMCPGMANGRCRLHGGLSTGPKTPEGVERSRRAVTKHGRYSKRARSERENYWTLLRWCRETLETIPKTAPSQRKHWALANIDV
jgi:hypothetical protein